MSLSMTESDKQIDMAQDISVDELRMLRKAIQESVMNERVSRAWLK